MIEKELDLFLSQERDEDVKRITMAMQCNNPWDLTHDTHTCTLDYSQSQNTLAL